MYFTLAISAATRDRCAALVSAALDTDPRVMPIPGPARVAGRTPDERTAVLHWGSQGWSDRAGASHAGTIWIRDGVGEKTLLLDSPDDRPAVHGP